MAFHIHRAERTDLLADGLGALLSTPLPDPFAQELVLVPARGVERWLSQRLSHVLGSGRSDDGVCAGVAFRSPRSLIAEITDTVDEDPWAPDALVWPLLDVIDTSLDEPWCQTLATHLGHFASGEEATLRRGRRYATARRLAGLFASYAAQRPQLLTDWADGAATDGAGGPLDADLAWQPELWRAVCARLPAATPAARHEQTLSRLRAAPVDLPARLSLFGHTRLSATDLALLEALATHHDLHLWLPHSSDALWRASAGVGGPVARTEDLSHLDARHPLLATLGRDLRELRRSLPAAGVRDDYIGGDRRRPDTVLGWLQSDIAANAPRPQNRTLTPDDRSVQVHSCHGPARQIDVLREVLLGLLVDDPTLEPRDILVMCPDIEAYAPLIVAGFGLGDVAGDRHPAHRLRVRLADRALVQTNPLLGVAAQVLALADGRATAGEVLNLAEAAPVRARFGFTDDDLESITAWVREAGIRWGIDNAHRARYGLDNYVQNTWRFGIDRVLAGVAMSDDAQAWLATTLPLDDVGSNKVELAGRVAEFVDRLTAVIDALSGTRALRDWIDTLRDGVGLLTRADGADGWQAGQLHREFAEIVDRAGEHAAIPLQLNDIRALLDRQLAGRPTRANFRTGTLTVCTMVPMRSIPHRVVCLVGLDDGVFPRIDLADGDDVLARRPMTGERDIRSEDRQLLLDAVMSATEKLVITYTGADEYSGHRRPPAVPLAELLDVLDQTTDARIRERILVQHPLQPFDVRNVTPGKLGVPTPFTFDPTVLTAATAAAGAPTEPATFPSGPLLAAPNGDVALADLISFVKNPVRGFFRTLDMALPREEDSIEEAMPIELDGLQRWQVGEQMLADLRRGKDSRWVLDAEWRRGTLPPGQLGWRLAKEIRDQAEVLARAEAPYRELTPQAVDVDIDLGAGRRLTGTVTPVHGTTVVATTFSRLDGRHLLDPWVRLLALAVTEPGRGWTAVCTGRGGDGVLTRILGVPPDPEDVLKDIVALYDAGCREPLPLPIKTSYTWAENRFRGRDPWQAAQRTWRSKYGGDHEDEAHVRVWGGPPAPFDALLGAPRPGEEVPGEDTRLGAFATRLWLPLLKAELRPGRGH
ncbi:exodeoxyribonuclease V subunit gamma [Mycolicibacterium mengxianglii]|uniref:exodeoxyribonuclease V subunit gamma n=1 Tax=Mycolicibacterium mengxianglii TaxID=2736649 RepID=UPI0018D130B0|nr:exodeoxyribonuclease V subunit gamma [Mycolicibacterium mengxianglii]